MPGKALRVHRKAVERQELRELRPWEYHLAQFIAQYPMKGRPPIESLMSVASSEAGADLPEDVVRRTITDPSFRRYRILVENDLVAAARKRLAGSALDVLNNHLEGMEWASDLKDPRAMAAITVPLLDRLLPKKDDSTPMVAVQVVLNQRQLSALEAPAPVVVVEAVVEPDDATA